MEHQGMADEWLNKAEQQLTEANRRSDEATKQIETAMEHQMMADERLNKAEQQLTEANRRADEATKQIERSAMEHRMMADERLNKIEQQLTEANQRGDEATKRVENLTMEHQMMADEQLKRAAKQLAELEQKFMDAMIRMERNSAERMDMNHVENLLHPQAEIAESLNNDMGSEDRGVTAVQKGKEKMVRLEFYLHSFGLNFLLKVPPPRRKYSRPPGGATSVIISMEEPSHTQPYYRSPSPFQPSKNCPRQYQPKLGKTAVQKGSKPVFGDDAEEDSRRSTKPSRRTIYPQSTLRGFSAIRAKQLVHLIYIDKLATYIA